LPEDFTALGASGVPITLGAITMLAFRLNLGAPVTEGRHAGSWAPVRLARSHDSSFSMLVIFKQAMKSRTQGVGRQFPVSPVCAIDPMIPALSPSATEAFLPRYIVLAGPISPQVTALCRLSFHLLFSYPCPSSDPVHEEGFVFYFWVPQSQGDLEVGFGWLGG